MATFHLTIATPDRLLFDGRAQELLARTTEGDVCILKGHIDYAAVLKTGRLKVTGEGGEERNAAVSAGLLCVRGDAVKVLAVTCEWADEIDLKRAERARDRAEALLREKKSKEELELAELRLKRSLNRLQVGQIK